MRIQKLEKQIACFVLICATCLGQQLTTRMTNQDVLDMVSLGLSDDVIIDKIHSVTNSNFDTSVPGLGVLKSAKVSEAVIRAMIRPTPVGNNMLVPKPNVTQTENTGQPLEVGVYLVHNEKLAEVQPEIVNWQTGGVLKSNASLGLVKGDVNGKVVRGKSPTRVAGPLEFLIKTPEGTSVEEYQLLRLHEKGNRREFRSVTGGILHVSGGAQRDEVAFETKKIGNRTWSVAIPRLPNGEYGFLPPGVASASISASGKMYTFGVVEESPRALWNTSQSPELQEASRPPTNASTDGSSVQGTIGASSGDLPTVRRDGITLSQVAGGGPADQAGIRVGDVILAVNDHYLFTPQELNDEVSRYRPGAKISIRYRRYATIYETFLVVGIKP